MYRMIIQVISLALLCAVVAGCPISSGSYMSLDDARSHFLKNRSLFEEIVAQAKQCPGVVEVHEHIDRDSPGSLCLDGGDVPPRKIQPLMHRAGVQWIIVSWSPVDAAADRPAQLHSISFVLYSRGLLTNGESVSIAYSELAEDSVQGDWELLLPSPTHWIYYSSR